MRPFLLSFLALILAGVRAAADDVTSRFHAELDHYYDDYLAVYPVDSVLNGDVDHRYDATWQDDISREGRARIAALCDRHLAALAQFDPAQLAPTDRMSYETLKWMLEIRREGTRQILALTPVNQFSCATLEFAQMASGDYVHPFNTEQDFRNFLGRARGFSQWVDDAIANMREGVARGVVAPRILMERTVPQLDELRADDEAKNILFRPLRKLPADLAPGAREKLAADYRAGIRTIMLPAYGRLADFIRQEYLPKCRDTVGLNAVPGGPEAYAYAVRLSTTTNLTPAEIHAIGLGEVARIRGEMDKIRTQVGFAGPLPAFLDYVATDPKFAPYKTAAEVLNAYRAIEARVMAGIPKLFDRIPREKFEIRETEAFREAAASAEYIPGAADGSRPGIFYVPVPDPKRFYTARMEDLFLHEAIPGHHFQFAVVLENPGLARFRRFDYNNAYVEGWALYAESLGPELGMYTDPYQRLGRLLGEMHRAVRLVVDTGMHAEGWSREQAIAYQVENEGGRPEQAQTEIERYIAWPGQALAYKIGERKIRELRTLAEKELGPKFDVRAFHDQVLDEGSLPLSVLETRIRTWIAAQGGAR